MLAWLSRCEARHVTLRIEERSEGEHTILCLSGRIQSEHLAELGAQLGAKRPGIALDLEDVTLVDVDAVRFLGICEANGVVLLHCPPYVREWILRERA